MEKIKSISECTDALKSVRDTLDILSGKWKILILITVGAGNMRFTTIQKSLGNISPKVLAQELKELEMNNLLRREVGNTYPATITYSWTVHTESIVPIIESLKTWGQLHRMTLFGSNL